MVSKYPILTIGIFHLFSILSCIHSRSVLGSRSPRVQMAQGLHCWKTKSPGKRYIGLITNVSQSASSTREEPLRMGISKSLMIVPRNILSPRSSPTHRGRLPSLCVSVPFKVQREALYVIPRMTSRSLLDLSIGYCPRRTGIRYQVLHGR